MWRPLPRRSRDLANRRHVVPVAAPWADAQILTQAYRSDTSFGPLFVGGAAEWLPFATGTFGVASSMLSLRRREDLLSGMCELARVLSPAGTLVSAGAEPDSGPLLERSRWPFRRQPGSLRLLVVRCGAVVIAERSAPVHGPAGRVHLLTARQERRGDGLPDGGPGSSGSPRSPCQ